MGRTHALSGAAVWLAAAPPVAGVLGYPLHYNNTYNIDPTDIRPAIYHDQSDFKEVQVLDGNYGSDRWYGRWYCSDWNSDQTVCLDGRAQHNLDKGPYSTDEARHLVCMEIGHAVGLAHQDAWTTSCMEEGAWGQGTLDSHDEHEINKIY